MVGEWWEGLYTSKLGLIFPSWKDNEWTQSSEPAFESTLENAFEALACSTDVEDIVDC